MSIHTDYKWLAPWPGSNYRQWFIKGRKVRAETLYHLTVNSEPRTPAEVAHDYELPLEAVLDYSIRNADLLQQEREADRAILNEMIAAGKIHIPPGAPDLE